jgi:exodeoxyribonuclease V beta subunit
MTKIAIKKLMPVASLNVMTLPLHGERLIEASAGTGKTYTIAGLYLRLLLGHGNADCCHSEPLRVDQILVVTFTEAATGELRERIRRRIVQARHAFLAGRSDDPIIKPLIEQSGDHQICARVLLQALRQMDEAAIFTIHGFCQRMLKQHAFESGSYFETEFVTDQSLLQAQAIEDFWRQHFYGMNDELDLTLAKLVKSYWQQPGDLLRDISSYLTNPYLVIQAQGQDITLQQHTGEIIAKISQLKQAWLSVVDQIEPEILSKKIDKRSYSTRNLPAWLNEVTQWAQTPSDDLVLCDKLQRFSRASLSEKTKDGPVPALEIFDLIEYFLEQQLGIKDAVLAKAIIFVREHITAAKQQQSLLSFDDLLSGLSGALNNQSASVLAQRIRLQYPLAMIDEFQDTDLMQYQIFNTIYGGQSDTGLLMIGDPKQAIYGFRGADIFTYIGARRAVAAHYTLDTNYRSSIEMVAGINALFSLHPAPFIYRDDIEFHPVKDCGKDISLSIDGPGIDGQGQSPKRKSAITAWLMPSDSTVSKADYLQAMALACATQINQLLTKGQQGQALINERPVVANDIAILVRTGAEARLVKQQLEQQGISSVYLSNRDSVFNAQVAQDLWRILMACLEPTNAERLRGALACVMLDHTAKQLDAFNNDEQLWQQAVDDFSRFALRWQDVGVLVMLRELIHHYEIPRRLLSLPGGERQLTDILHLGEVLQQQSLEMEGEHALTHWLSDKVNNPDQDVQEQQLRLESDRDLVQIVTIHKSKGLEYQLVFLPFICSFRKETRAVFHQDNQTVVDLTHTKESLEKADHERLAEDLRLLYVAITRAVCHCWLGLAPLKSGKATKEAKTDLHLSAIGHLLFGGEVCTSAQLIDQLTKLSVDAPMISITEPPVIALTPYRATAVTAEIEQARNFSGAIENDYWITSYSALSRSNHSQRHPTIDATTEQFNIDWEASIDSLNQPIELLLEPQDALPEQNIFTFPRGAEAGTFLHTLFEEIDFSEASDVAFESKVMQLLTESEYDQDWCGVLVKLINDVLDAALDEKQGEKLSLRGLANNKKLVEMEFFIPLSPFNSQDLNRLLAKHDPLSKLAPPLTFGKIQGMLKGFIDLVFVDNDRYYIVDYKSNHLGAQLADYQQQQLSDVMIDHRYDFQYQLYSLALHRLLATRIPDYDYDIHFGGIYYLFLRGIDPNAHDSDPSCGIFHNRPSKAFITELDVLFSQGAS